MGDGFRERLSNGKERKKEKIKLLTSNEILKIFFFKNLPYFLPKMIHLKLQKNLKWASKNAIQK